MTIKHLNIATFICALVVWSACGVTQSHRTANPVISPPPAPTAFAAEQVQNIDIARIETDTLEGIQVPDVQDPFISDLSIDSIVIDLDQNKFEHDKTGKALKLGQVQVDRLVSQPSNGRPSSKSPVRIESLVLRTVILKKDGKEVKRLYNHRQTDFHANWFIEKTADSWKEKEQEYKLQIERLEQKIKDLHKLINTVLEQFPDHAARMMDPDLKHIEGIVAEIRDWHSKNLPDMETIQSDISRLASMELTVFDMSESLQNPAENQSILETRVLFRTGEYQIARSESTRVLDSLVRQMAIIIEPDFQRYPDRFIKVDLAVTGYADNQPIYGDLASDLYKGQIIPVNVVRGSDSKAEQDYLNLRLSQERAKSVSRYIENALRKMFLGRKILLVQDPVGWGRSKSPARVQCPTDDCIQRRVVVISDVKYSIGEDVENR